MLSFTGSTTTALEWCFFCGEPTLRRKEHLSIRSLHVYASEYKNLLVFHFQKRHCVLKTVHPSPLSASRGFFGCKHFSKANDYLKKNERKEIDWKNLPTDIQL